MPNAASRPLVLGALALAGLAAGPSRAGDPVADGLATIRQMAGCHSVTYRFYEDGRHDSFRPNSGLAKPIQEVVAVAKEGPGSITLSHASISPEGETVPHWHEDWRWQERSGGWTQEVWSRAPESPRRELRYSCTAPWAGNLWECHAGRAPKPFRDDGAPFGFQRTDYDWLDRFNAILVTERGWIQNERNRKMTSDGRTVAQELGWITYEKLPPEQCAAAKSE